MKSKEGTECIMVKTFAIFDTLIMRKTATREGLFLKIETEIRRNKDYQMVSEHVRNYFSKFRLNAEQVAYRKAQLNGRFVYTLEDIYDCFAYMTGISEEIKQRMMECEIIAERDNYVPVWKLINFLIRDSENNDIYLIEDSYLPQGIIREILTNIHDIFKDIPMILSGEANGIKKNGSIYWDFCQENDIASGEWMHIGTDEKLDGIQVMKCGGIPDIHLSEKLSVFEENILKRYKSSLACQLLLGVVRLLKSEEKTDFYKIGLSWTMPILYGYVSWILEQVDKQDIKEVFFIARDGYILKKMADVLIKERKLDIQTHYIYGSRKAWGQMNDIENKLRNIDDLEFLSYFELIKKLDIVQEDLEELFPDELKKMDQNYTEKELSDVRGILRNARELVKRTVEREKRRICNAKQYLKQELGGVVNRVVFVDANGSGNTQKYLKELVKDFFEQPIVTFFYCMGGISDEQTNGNIFYKYCYEQFKAQNIIETLTRAPHNRTIDYALGEQAQQWYPVMAEGFKDYLSTEVYEEYMKGIIDGTKALGRFDQCSGSEYAEISFAYVEYLCEKPDKDMLEFIGEMPFEGNYQRKGQSIYAPKLNDEEIIRLCCLKDEGMLRRYFYEANLEFSLLRASKQQKKYFALTEQER